MGRVSGELRIMEEAAKWSGRVEARPKMCGLSAFGTSTISLDSVNNTLHRTPNV